MNPSEKQILQRRIRSLEKRIKELEEEPPKMRWIRTCDEHGVKSEFTLQQWSPLSRRWESVGYVECKDWEYDKVMDDPTEMRSW